MAKRRIVVDGTEYIYVVGSDFVRFTDPTGHSRAVPLTVITGLDWQEIERAKRKQYFKVTPADIAFYLAKPVDTPST